MRSPLTFVAGLLALLGLLVAAGVMRAQPTDKTILDTVLIEPLDDGARIRLEFLCPVQYKTHFPHYTGDELRIRLEPVRVCPGEEDTARNRGATPADDPTAAWLSDVIYDGEIPGGPFVSLHFERQMVFEVLQGADFRSIIVLVHPVP